MEMRSEKKTETLEVRLGYGQKATFMDACREQGLTASDVIREYIDGFLAQHQEHSAPKPPISFREVPLTVVRHPRRSGAAAFGAGALALLFGATPSVAGTDVRDVRDAESAERHPAVAGGSVSGPMAEDVARDQIVSVTRQRIGDSDNYRIEGIRADFRIIDDETVLTSVWRTETTVLGHSDVEDISRTMEAELRSQAAPSTE
jgi:hypothetical protein